MLNHTSVMRIFLQLSLSLWYRFSLHNQTQWVHSLVSTEPVITTKRQKSEVCYLQQVRIAQGLTSTQGTRRLLKTHNYSY